MYATTLICCDLVTRDFCLGRNAPGILLDRFSSFERLDTKSLDRLRSQGFETACSMLRNEAMIDAFETLVFGPSVASKVVKNGILGAAHMLESKMRILNVFPDKLFPVSSGSRANTLALNNYLQSLGL